MRKDWFRIALTSQAGQGADNVHYVKLMLSHEIRLIEHDAALLGSEDGVWSFTPVRGRRIIQRKNND